MDPAVLEALEAARQFDWSLPATAAATAAARNLAIVLGAKHPEAGTCKAIQAVLDQLENPSSFTSNSAAYEKHGAGRGTFLKWKKKLKSFVSLADLKANAKLGEMKVVQKGQRLSIQPVTAAEWKQVCKMGGITA